MRGGRTVRMLCRGRSDSSLPSPRFRAMPARSCAPNARPPPTVSPAWRAHPLSRAPKFIVALLNLLPRSVCPSARRIFAESAAMVGVDGAPAAQHRRGWRRERTTNRMRRTVADPHRLRDRRKGAHQLRVARAFLCVAELHARTSRPRPAPAMRSLLSPTRSPPASLAGRSQGAMERLFVPSLAC